MKFLYYLILIISLGTTGCAVQTNQGMTMGQLNNAVGLSGNGNLVLVNRVGDYEIYQSSAVLDWKRQIAQGNAIAKSILTPEKNVYYVLKGGALQQEVVGDANLNSFVAKLQPNTQSAAQQNSSNPTQPGGKSYMCQKEASLFTFNGVAQEVGPGKAASWTPSTKNDKNRVRIEVKGKDRFSITDFAGATSTATYQTKGVTTLTAPFNLNLQNQAKLDNIDKPSAASYYLPQNYAALNTFGFYQAPNSSSQAGIGVYIRGTCRPE